MNLRDRSLLHKSRLGEFAGWLADKGWAKKKTKGGYEALRMRHPNEGILIVYMKSSATQHCTVQGIAYRMARAFLRDKKRTRGQS